ncbi:MAG: hypothetical protein ACM3JC_08035 [Rudaea sp.]
MRALSMLLAVLATGVLATSAHASSGTNFSDQWWNPNESGWGASISQQADVMYVELYVYGPDSRPTWYSGALYFQPSSGRLLFTGDLNVYSGPWFGGSFNPAFVSSRKVGTIAFEASSTDTATLTYSVDGRTYVKDIERQLWAYEDFNGSYYGGFVYEQSSCSNPDSNGHVEELGSIDINQTSNNTFTLTLESSFGTCTITGPYSQLGHMGRVDASYACSYAVNGTLTLYELERTDAGMTGRFVATNNVCDVAGTLGGVRR